MNGLISLIPNNRKSDWGISIPFLYKGYSQHGHPRTVAFIYVEGTYRLCLCACQICGSCATLITLQPQPRQDDCRPDRKWMEIMTGRPDACLPSVRADIVTTPVWFQRSSAQQGEKSMDRFLFWQLRIFWLQLLFRLQFDWMLRPLSCIDSKVASPLERPLNGRCRRTSLLKLIIKMYHLNRTEVYCGGLAGGFMMI